MSTQTNKLGLFKYDPVVDKEELFDIQEALNDNWDKIDNSIKNADWNQNDETAPDYVKNRPFYTEVTTANIISEQTVSGFALMENTIYAVENPFKFIPIEGQTYDVVWDGITYKCECAKADAMLYIGNSNYVNMQSGGDIPFTIIYTTDGLFLATESTSESHTVTIIGEGEVIKKIDEKYLPDYLEYGLIFKDEYIIEDYAFSGTYADTDINYRINEGEVYDVIWDGTPYRNLTVFLDGYDTLGTSVYTIRDGSGDPPFALRYHGSLEVETYVGGYHSISLIRKYIPKNHLPSEVATKADIEAAIGNALPAVTASDNGKFLRVVNGAPAWATVQNAEEVSF